MKKYKKYVVKGSLESTAKIPFHSKSPFRRYLMLGKKLVKESNTHIAIHNISKIPKNLPDYSFLHKHNVDEINLIISEKGRLTYQIQLEDEIYRVSSPATIFIPKGIRHKARPISGAGFFVCIILSTKYQTSS